MKLSEARKVEIIANAICFAVTVSIVLRDIGSQFLRSRNFIGTGLQKTRTRIKADGSCILLEEENRTVHNHDK